MYSLIQPVNHHSAPASADILVLLVQVTLIPAVLYTSDVLLSLPAVVGMVCTLDPQCTDVLANTACESSQCACFSGYSGASRTGNTNTCGIVHLRCSLISSSCSWYGVYVRSSMH